MSNHNHHIVPIYKCIELGLTTSYKVDGIEFYFKENLLPDTARIVHADIHWGYYCKDLSTLLEHCNPPQWVIDMIPLGDIRDMWSAKPLAMGEIDGIDMSNENNPFFGKKHTPETKQKISKAKITHGRYVGAKNDPKIAAAAAQVWRDNRTPEEIEEDTRKRIEKRPDRKAYDAERSANRTPEELEDHRRKDRDRKKEEYANMTPEKKEERQRKNRENKRVKVAEKKALLQGVGTLEPLLT